MTPIEMIVWFTQDGVPHPLKYRLLQKDGSYTVVKVGKVISSDKERLAGNNMLIYRCQSIVHGIEKLYELKYEIATCKWFLYKM